MTAQQALLLPVVLHFLMTMGLGITTALARRKALIAGKARRKEVALDNRAWPDDVRKLGNNFDNQFQLPMLWYAGVAFTLILGLADSVSVILCWAFLLVRIAHSIAHIGRNILLKRFSIFVIGAGILIAFWLWLALRFFG